VNAIGVAELAHDLVDLGVLCGLGSGTGSGVAYRDAATAAEKADSRREIAATLMHHDPSLAKICTGKTDAERSAASLMAVSRKVEDVVKACCCWPGEASRACFALRLASARARRRLPVGDMGIHEGTGRSTDSRYRYCAAGVGTHCGRGCGRGAAAAPVNSSAHR
jgi:hypothetical protein